MGTNRWSFLAIASLSLGRAHQNQSDVPDWVPGCIMANTQAVNDMVDSALFIYASAKSCKVEPGANFRKTANCVSDLAAVVKSVNGVGEFMVKVFKTCGEINTSNLECGIAGAHLTGSLAGVTSSASAAVADCAPPGDSIKARPGKYAASHISYSTLDVCTINIGAAMSGLQAAIISLMTMRGKCGKGDRAGTCVSGVLDMISGVGNLAVFIENVVAKCSHGSAAVSNQCAADIGSILAGFAATASSAVRIRESCTAQSSLLYAEHSAEMSKPATVGGANVLSAMLLVLIPITGLVSYFGGAKYGKGSRTIRQLQARANQE